MTSLHKQIIDSHHNDIAKLKSSMSNKAAARRSVCLPSTFTITANENDSPSPSTINNNVTSNNSPSRTTTATGQPKSILKTGLSKEEPIISKTSSSSGSSTTNTTTTTTSSNTTNKKIPDRPSINPGFRKPKEALLSGISNNSSYRKSTTGSNIKPPSQISSSTATLTSPPLSNTTTTTTTTTTTSTSNTTGGADDSQIKHTAASLSKMKLSASHTIDSQRSTMKTRSVSISNGTLFSPTHGSVNSSSSSSNNTTPTTKTPIKSNIDNIDTPSTPKTPSNTTSTPSSSTSTTPSTTTPTKTNIDDVFARLANVSKPTIKSRSLSVSASLSKEQQQKEKLEKLEKQEKENKDKHESSTSLSSKFTKILRSSKTPSSPSTTTTTTSSSASKVNTPRERKDTKSLSSFKSSSASKATSSSTTTTHHNITESNSLSTSSLISSPPPSTPSNNLTSILVQQSSSPSLSATLNTQTISKCPSPSPSSSTNSTAKVPVLTPAVALKLYRNELTAQEQAEIFDFPEIYFTGNTNKKINPNPKLPNNGFDTDTGEYKIVERDHIAYRFEVVSILGQGSFCQVVKAYDYKTSNFVALKILRNQKRFHEQALTEIKILEYLKNNDPNSTANIVHLNNHFYFRNHLCLTFELLSMSLYDFLKDNNFQGYSLNLVWRFAAQILTSLKFLSNRNIIHADLKPENILLKQSGKSGIKIIDFGSSCFENEQIFPYIQSRFYRSPEVILGIRYDKSIDIWSLGCILVEIFTGSPLFPGADEPEQLACIMEVLGVPPKTIIDESTRRDIFFEDDYSPKQVKNSTTGEIYGIGTKSLKEILNSGDDDFDQFIFDCLKWDPSERMTAEQGLKSNWISKLAIST